MSTTTSKSTLLPINLARAMGQPELDQSRGRRIEELMTAQGWDASDLARAMRVDRGRIYDWKAGKPIRSILLERLAVALQTTRLYIETGEGDMYYPRGDAPLLLLKQLEDAAAGLDLAPEQDPPSD